MNRLLKMSAAAISTLFLTTGATALANSNSCPTAPADCNAANGCSVSVSDCSDPNCSDLSGIIGQCSNATDVLSALIENGCCNSDDLKCLISDGTCSVDDVCTALEGCDSDCVDVQGIINDISCGSDEACNPDCNSDIDLIKSLFGNVCADNGSCASPALSLTECSTVNSTSAADCAGTAEVKTVVEVIKGDCKDSDTSSKADDETDKESCTSDCESADVNCQDGNCEDSDCSDGSCYNDNLNSVLNKYGININDCINNGKYTVTYGNYEDINSILKSFGLNSQNNKPESRPESKPVEESKPAAESKPTTESKPAVESKPTTESKPAVESKPTTESKPEETTSSTPDTDSKNNSSVSDYEKQVVDLVNAERAKYGLKPLTLNTELSAVARAKSQDMHDKRYFSHTSPTYGSPFDMMKSFGISYRTAGENIAMGQRTPEEVVNAWMNSEGHRANILNSSFTDIGVGYVADGNYWTQMFIG